MIPIGDDNTGHIRTPYVNYILIAINILVFVLLQGMGGNDAFIMSYATVPHEILTGTDVIYEGGLGVSPQPVYLTLLTSMFMHASIAHIGSNMLYLWVFGDNLENRMGHVKYLVFYLVTGFLASMAHVLASEYFNKDLMIPSLGASGAISGVLGGYLMLFPKNSIRVWFIGMIIRVPAIITLGLWIGLQLLSGWGSLGSEGGGVAYAAHIGGFVAGMLLVRFFASPVKPLPEEKRKSFF